jgi:hypothetical protein
MQTERNPKKHAHRKQNEEELGEGGRRERNQRARPSLQARSRPSAVSSTVFVDLVAAEGGEEGEVMVVVDAELSLPTPASVDDFAAACWWCFFFDFCDLLPVRGGLEEVDVGCC